MEKKNSGTFSGDGCLVVLLATTYVPFFYAQECDKLLVSLWLYRYLYSDIHSSQLLYVFLLGFTVQNEFGSIRANLFRQHFLL